MLLIATVSRPRGPGRQPTPARGAAARRRWIHRRGARSRPLASTRCRASRFRAGPARDTHGPRVQSERSSQLNCRRSAGDLTDNLRVMRTGGSTGRINACAVTAAVALAFAPGAGVAVATGPASPGDPPSLEFRRCAKADHCTRPVVLASGVAYRYGTEIVGYGRDDPHGRNLCLELDWPYYPIFGICGSRQAIVRPKPALTLRGWSGFDDYDGRLTHVLGTTKANVGSVRVRYRRGGRWKQARTIFGVVGKHLADRIRQKSPFGVFTAAMPRCIDARRIRATAYDDAAASSAAAGSSALTSCSSAVDVTPARRRRSVVRRELSETLSGGRFLTSRGARRLVSGPAAVLGCSSNSREPIPPELRSTS